MTILLSDPRVAAIPVVDTADPLVTLPPEFGPACARVRSGVASRLIEAARALPAGVHLHVVEGHRLVHDQLAIIARYTAEVRAAHPRLDDNECRRLVSRFVSPIDVAPHVAGAAIDVTLVDDYGAELVMGTPIDATPEQSHGACFFDATNIDIAARRNRTLLAAVLTDAGLVNYPTEWWHWSYGDRYWALQVSAPAALYGPTDQPVGAGGQQTRRTVIVLGGGQNGEHDVSRASAADIAAAIDRRAFDVLEVTLERNGKWTKEGNELSFASVAALLERSTVAVPAFHGVSGEDGTVAGLLRSAGVPFVGSSTAAGAFGIDKRVTKLLAQAAGVTTAAGIAVSTPDAEALKTVPLPAVVKPNRGGSSQGVTLVRDRAGLRAAVETALRDDSLALIEEVLHGREVDMGILQHPDGTLQCSPPLEITIEEGELYDNNAKYGGNPLFSVPAALSDNQVSEMQTAALRVFSTLGCSGLARIDFFVTASGLVLNEVNTFPGFTDHSQFPQMFKAAGIGYAQLVQILIDSAVRLPGR